MANGNKIKDMLDKIDFGDIDGLYDRNLSQYFLDENYWDKLIEKDVFYVIGRKGTGKSAIYNWIHKQQNEKSALISNLSFKEFPFEKLLKLTDDDFSKPNQYQSIWRNIILSEIARLIILDQQNEVNDNYKILQEYVEYTFGEDIVDLHKQITMSTEKTTTGLTYRVNLNSESSKTKNFDDGIHNITRINRMLEKNITDYLNVNGINKYIIQFDQLDDNYTSYSNSKEYFQCIISLFKTVYDIDQTFRVANIPAKTILYLRSDIFYSINNVDAESARWDQYKLDLNWSIINKSDWNNPKLLQLINKRIVTSLNNLEQDVNPFDKVFNNEIIKLKDGEKIQDIFKYMIFRTFHRPRDMVQFCLKIQEQMRNTGDFYFRTIKDAEKDYSLWLLSELKNELSPKIKELDTLYEFLRQFGSKIFSMNDFKIKYRKYKDVIEFEPEDLLRLLYTFGIIYNINNNPNNFQMFSIIRNDRSVFNRDLKIQLHPGYYKGLHISKFFQR